MKKALFLLSVLIFSMEFAVCSFSYESDAHPYMLIGFVNKSTLYSVTMNESVMPFDLDGYTVAFNPDYENIVKGIQIGTYSVVSNSAFEIYIAHTPLSIVGGSEAGTYNSIDYRLSVFGSSGFSSQLSDANASMIGTSPSSVSKKIIISSSGGYLRLDNKGLYVSLDDRSLVGNNNLPVVQGKTPEQVSTETVLAGLSSGSYESTIYIMAVGE